MICCVCAVCLFIVTFVKVQSRDVNELEFYNEEEDRKVDWGEVPPASVRAMTRRIDRLCQIIKHMDDTVAETLMYLMEEEGEEVLDNMRVYCMGLDNLVEFMEEYTNITVHFGKSLLERGPPKWIPAYFEPKMTFSRFNWTQIELDRMYQMNEHAKRAFSSFSQKLKEKM